MDGESGSRVKGISCDAIFPSLRLCNSFSPGWSKGTGPGSKQTFSEKNPWCKNPYPLACQEHLGLTTPTFDFFYRVLTLCLSWWNPPVTLILLAVTPWEHIISALWREGINISLESNNELPNKLLLKNVVYVIINDKTACLLKSNQKINQKPHPESLSMRLIAFSFSSVFRAP